MKWPQRSTCPDSTRASTGSKSGSLMQAAPCSRGATSTSTWSSMSTRTIFAAIGTLGALAAAPLRAQTIRGRLVDAANHVAVAGALTELRDLQGKVLQQAFTSPTGAFVFVAPPNQKYQVRIAAIGFARHGAVGVTLGTDAVVIPDIVLTAVVVSLPELRAMSGKSACGRSEL